MWGGALFMGVGGWVEEGEEEDKERVEEDLGREEITDLMSNVWVAMKNECYDDAQERLPSLLARWFWGTRTWARKGHLR